MCKEKLRRAYILFCVSLLPLILTACGKSAEEKALARTARAQTFGIIGLVVNLIVCIPILMGIMKSNNTAKRGTNAVTRFVRKGATHWQQSMYYKYLALLLVLDVLFLFFPTQFHFIKLLDFLPPIGCVVYIMISITKSKNDKERIKDARVVTKGSLQVASATAEATGAVAAGTAAALSGADPHTIATASKAGRAAGKVLGSVADTCASNMEVEGFNGLDTTKIGAATEEAAGLMGAHVDAAIAQKSARIEAIADTELFRSKALRLGCNENMSLGEMAKVVLKYAPAASLAELPEDMSDEDKAVALLGAYKQQPKALPQNSAPAQGEVVEGEFREV